MKSVHPGAAVSSVVAVRFAGEIQGSEAVAIGLFEGQNAPPKSALGRRTRSAPAAAPAAQSSDGRSDGGASAADEGRGGGVVLPAELEWVDKLSQGAVKRALALGDFKGKAGSVQSVPAEGAVRRVMLVGLGKPAGEMGQGFDLEAVRWAAGATVKAARGAKVGQVNLVLPALPGGASAEAVGQAAAEGAVLAGFIYDEFKKAGGNANGGNGNGAARGVTLTVVETDARRRAEMAAGGRVGEIIGRGANYARRLASRPGNVMHPAAVVEEAKGLAKRAGLKIRVIGRAEAERLGMGGLVAVGRGSAVPPALIVLEHEGGNAKRKTQNAKQGGEGIAVVGKAITFDSGGISIKPSADMDQMKFDKSGGMAVLGIMQAVAELKLPQRVIGVVPVAENAVGGDAYRPGDILRMFNGKTVEVTNTDAEGRLILADALAYAGKMYRPEVMIDMATLTGGVVVALGSVYGGLFANDDALARALEKAGLASGEWLWRLPLHERYKPLLEGTHGEIVNSGGREAHPAQGAIFLQYFVPAGVKWAHLDIAGMAHPKKDERYLTKGATGFGVRVVMEYLRGRGGEGD